MYSLVVPILFYVYTCFYCVHWSRLFVIDFTQLSTQLRPGVRCTIIEHAAVVLLQIHVFVSTVTSWKKSEGNVSRAEEAFRVWYS